LHFGLGAFGIFDPGIVVRIGNAEFHGLGQCLVALFGQVGIDKSLNLFRLGVHDAVQSEVQLGLIKQEQFFQQLDEFLFLVVVAVIPGCITCRR